MPVTSDPKGEIGVWSGKIQGAATLWTAPIFMRVWSVAPIRINDCGGWTDTWFAERGCVCCVGVSPFVEVQAESTSGEGRIEVVAENFGATFEPSPEREHHPLVEAAFEALELPRNADYKFNIFSEMPPGAGTGTSASVSVALVGALDHLRGGQMTPNEIAKTAFGIETELLGRQSGVQDQLCAAYGGLLRIDVTSFPEAHATRLEPPDDVYWELEHRLVLVYLGSAHNSSDLHQTVIRTLEGSGPNQPDLEELRHLAHTACGAMETGDFDLLGRTMKANSEAQRRLHPSLVSATADRIFELAARFGAAGWKVNGAGGEGGSVSILCGPDMAQKRAFLKAMAEGEPSCRAIPSRISRLGLRVWSR